MMSLEQEKFKLYLTVLRFVVGKVTSNLRKANLDIDLDSRKLTITAYYQVEPSELDQELLDDIGTNTDAHLPDFIVHTKSKLLKIENHNQQHDFIVFSFYEPFY